MRESNEIEKLDTCINKIKFINTCLISVFKSKGATSENKEYQKGVVEWRTQIAKNRSLVDKFLKEYLPNTREEVKVLTIKESNVLPESLRNSSRMYEQFNQCIEFTFLKVEEAKEAVYQLFVDLYTRTKQDKITHIVHRKLRNSIRLETLRWLDRDPLEKVMETVKNFYFEYWKDIIRGEIICMECKATMALNEAEGSYLPPTIVETRKDTSRNYYHDKCFEKRRPA